MAKVNAPLLSFNRGEVSKLALARVDIEKMRLAAEAQVNWMPYTMGAMMLRPGTEHLFSTRSDAACTGIPFIFGTNDTAILEISEEHLRVIVDDELVARGSVSTVVTNGDFSSATGWTLTSASGTADIDTTVADALYLAAGSGGDVVSAVRSVSVAGGDQNDEHAIRVIVTSGPVTFSVGSTSGGGEYISKQSLGAGTHSLVFTPTGATFYVYFESALRYGVIVDSAEIESSGTLDLPTPWAAADLSKIRYHQSGDIVFIACDGYQQRKIERRNNNSWSVVRYYTDDGPFKTQNFDTSRTILASAREGSITLTGMNTTFSADDIGSIIWLEESDFSVVAEWKPSETIAIPTAALIVAGAKIGDFTNLANAFDGNAATFATKGSAGYIGINEAAPSTIFTSTLVGQVSVTAGSYINVSATLYAKTGIAPSNATDGTQLGFNSELIFAPTNSAAFDFVVTSGDTTTTWDYIWWAVSATVGSASLVTISIGEITGTAFTATGVPLLRRYNGNTYQAISGTSTGITPPIHTMGDLLSEPSGVIWRFRSSSSGVVRVTAVASTTSLSGDVLRTIPDSVATRPTWSWANADWSDAEGWPTEVRFFEGRLWWFRGDKRWGSISDAYYSFDAEVDGDSGTINRTFGSGPIAKINFALDLTRLIIGREMSIDPVRSSSFEEPLTPTNSAAKSCTTKGAAEFPALKVGSRGVYVEKSGRRVYELKYEVQAGDYTAGDLTRLNLDIGIPGFTSLAVQEQPDTSLHFVRTDGQNAVLLYEPDEQLECWWRMMTLGVIERVVVLPGSLEDIVYFVVKRTINGSPKRFWEKLAQRSECVGGDSSKNLDCHTVVSQASSTTISGLSHLVNESVSVWANGKDLGSYTVSVASITVSEAVTDAIVGLGGVTYSYDSATPSATLTTSTAYNGYPAEVYADGKYIGALTVAAGIITLPNGRTANKITAYLGLYAPFRSAKLAYGAQMGTALGQFKKVEKVGLIAFDTHYQGVSYGSSIDNLQPLPLVEGGQDTDADTVWSEFDRPMIGLSGSWDTDSRLHLLAQAPKPVTLAGVVIAVNTSEAR